MLNRVKVTIMFTFLDPTALIRYMDLTFAEFNNIEIIKARFRTLTTSNIAYQNHNTRIMYWRSTFGGNRHLKLVISSPAPVPVIVTLQLLSRGNILANTFFLSSNLELNTQLNPRKRNWPSITRFVNHIQNITLTTSKIWNKLVDNYVCAGAWYSLIFRKFQKFSNQILPGRIRIPFHTSYVHLLDCLCSLQPF